MTEKQKRVLRSNKALQLLAIQRDFATIRSWWDAGQLSQDTLRKTLSELEKVEAFEEHATVFRKWLQENLDYEAARGRGRKAPAVGDKRSYRVQQITSGDPFARVPLGSLGVSKGESILVSYEDGRTVITKV